MRNVALIGYPLAHSVTPAIYAATFAAMGIKARCEKWVTPPQDLAQRTDALRGPAMFGANVTVPHKEAVIPLLDDVEASARSIGAVNCIVRSVSGSLTGHNTDKYGFARSLREAGFDAKGRRAMVLGAGGAARAVVAGLVEAGIGSVRIANRTKARALELAADFSSAGTAIEAVDWHGAAFDEACRDSDLIINTTPLGTAHTTAAAESPVGAGNFSPGAYAYDLVYNPAETPFMALAVQAGAIAVSGLEMLIYQGAESIRLWTGQEPPVGVMREAATAALQGRLDAVVKG